MTEGKWMPLRRPIPWGLLGMIGLVWSIEKFEVRRDYALESFHGANWRATAKLVEKSVKDAGILCFGDSLMRDGVYPAVLQEVTGKTAYNLAVPTGPAPASYVLLRRALERGARPSAIVVDFDADVLKEGPRSTRRPYPWADLLTVPEMIDLAWQSRDFEVFARIAVKRLLWSEKNRFEIREAIVAGFRNEVTSLRMNLLGCFRNWKINNGAQVNPIGGITEDPPVPDSIPARTSTWACHPVNRFYVDRFLDLAERRKIAVFWVIPPFSPLRQSATRVDGLEAAATRFIEDVRARHPSVVIVDGRHSGYDKSTFFDPAHLNRAGATSLSASLGALINIYLDDRSALPSWVRLRNYAPTTTATPLEDIMASIDYARKMAGPIVRR